MATPNKDSVFNSFEADRPGILSQPWAPEISVDEVKGYLAGLSSNRFASKVYQESHRHPYIQPRGGLPTVARQKKLSEALDQAGADFIPLTIDSHTRLNDYSTAQRMLKESQESGQDHLNGYPLVLHGPQQSRQTFLNIDKPISLRHGTPDARLLVETAIASGITEIEGGALSYCLPYSDRFPIDRSLLYWQYVDRLCADYSTLERPIHRESFGPLTATLVPPVIVVAIQLIELLLSVEQGVKSFGVSFGQSGSLFQDIALARVLMDKSREYLQEFGFGDVHVSLVVHQWMGPFPMDRRKADQLIALCTVEGLLTFPDKIVTKTRDEAFGIPTIESNAEAVSDVQRLFKTLPISGSVQNEETQMETALIRSEVDALMESIFSLPGGSFWESVYQAFCYGFLDVPFSPHCMNPNQLVAIRDQNHSIRIKEAGNIPLHPHDLQQEHELLAPHTGPEFDLTSKIIDDINIMV